MTAGTLIVTHRDSTDTPYEYEYYEKMFTVTYLNIIVLVNYEVYDRRRLDISHPVALSSVLPFQRALERIYNLSRSRMGHREGADKNIFLFEVHCSVRKFASGYHRRGWRGNFRERPRSFGRSSRNLWELV